MNTYGKPPGGPIMVNHATVSQNAGNPLTNQTIAI